MRNPITRVHRQQGAILVTSLLLLLVLTVLGVTMMKMTNMQERMAGNTRDLNLALQASEAALRDGETRIGALPAGWNDFTGAAGCAYCQKHWLPVDLESQTNDYWNANSREFGDEGKQEFTKLSADPRFVVEDAGFVGDSIVVDEPEGRQFFSVTARSTGATGQSNTVLQTTYARRF